MIPLLWRVILFGVFLFPYQITTVRSISMDWIFGSPNKRPKKRSIMATLPKQVFAIGCCGTGYVAMDEARLETLLEDMPTLRFLLLGHPNMAEPTIKQSASGTKVLEIPEELEIAETSFLLLVNCFFGVEPLPSRTENSRLTELTETITKLGGCARLEKQLKNIVACNPLTPEDDAENKYVWAVIQYDTIYHDRMNEMMSLGFSYTTSKKVDYRDNHYFRKERQTSAQD